MIMIDPDILQRVFGQDGSSEPSTQNLSLVLGTLLQRTLKALRIEMPPSIANVLTGSQ